mmetsp:Transcript_54807/g.159904  ORF Transcript_54807/g.159904 Transcript_54807/m.159904 type:complete len:352 (-) Transcript_54807:165-1220(-)
MSPTCHPRGRSGHRRCASAGGYAIVSVLCCIALLWAWAQVAGDDALGTSRKVSAATLAYVSKAGVPAEDVHGVAELATAVGATGPEPLSDPLTLLRFYIGHGRCVKRAASKYRATMKWRAEYSIQSVMAEYGQPGEYLKNGGRATDAARWTWRKHPRTDAAKLGVRHAFFSRLRRHDPIDGAPILVWQIGRADFEGFVREGIVDELIRAFVAHLEDALQSSRAASLQRRRLVRARVIIEAKDFALSTVRHLRVLIGILDLCERHYPEVLATITVVRTPLAAAHVYRMVSPFVPDLVRKKLGVFGDDFGEALRRHSGLEISLLPACLGGSASDSELGAAELVPIDLGRRAVC